MKHFIRIILFSTVFAIVAGCGQSGSEPEDPNAPVLSSIGNKTVTIGDTLNFTISATDPNGLMLTYDSDGSVGSGPNPYSNNASFNANTRQFSWNTTGAAVDDYYVEFSVINTAGNIDRETIRIRVQAEQTPPPPSDQYTTGQTLYNNSCRGSGCHRNEDDNLAEGARFGVLCLTADEVKTVTENPPGNGSMPPFNFSSTEEAAISYYLFNVRPEDCPPQTP
ncbi:hypothetical protein [Kaarinaea lacus]